MRRLTQLLLVAALAAWAAPAGAGQIYLLDPIEAALFEIDPDGPGADPVQPFSILEAGFDVDLSGSGQLLDLIVLGDGASLTLDAPVALTALGTTDWELGPASATLTLGGSSNTVVLLNGYFSDLGGQLTIQFFGGGDGVAGPPNVSTLLFTANSSSGSLPSMPVVPEPSGPLLFGLGLLVAAPALRSHGRRRV
jgi:hypothetical protein